MRFLTLLIFVFAGFSSWAQQYAYDIGVNVLPGFLVAHREDSKNLEAHVMGYDIQFSRRNISEKPWAKGYRRPQFGVNILYMDLGIPNLTGKAFSIGPNFQTSIIGTNNDHLNLRFGTGLGYLTEKFDKFKNRRNQAIGSHVNGLIQLNLNWSHNFSKLPIESSVGLGLSHFSNGSVHVPNLGVNMPSFFFGLKYQFGKVPEEYETNDTIRIPKWNIYSSYASKERGIAKQDRFGIVNIGVERIIRRNLTKQWRVGSDLFFDKTHYYIDNPGKELRGLDPLEMTEFGFFGGHQWLIYKVHVFCDIGLYAYKPSNHKFFTYQRIGFKYHIQDHWYMRATLKTHFGVADFVDWGIGYSL